MGQRHGAVAAGCIATVIVVCLPVILPVAVLSSIVRGIAASGTVTPVSSTAATAPMHCSGLGVARGFQLPVHAGIDIDCPPGTPVVATVAGVVRRRSDLGGSCVMDGAVRFGGYGMYVVLEPDAAPGVRYIHAHLSGYAARDGSHVKAGDAVGYEGTTGCSSGPHLHFEVRTGGAPTNPCPYLPEGYPTAAWHKAGCPLHPTW